MRTLAISLTLLVLVSCGGKHPGAATQIAPGQFEVPLVASKDAEVFTPVPGEDVKDLEAVITVNASEDHPITAPVKIRVYDKKKGLLDRLKPSNVAKHDIVTESSDTIAAQGVTADQPHVAVWWWWAGVGFLFLVLVLVVSLVVYSKLKNLNPMGIVKSILSRFF